MNTIKIPAATALATMQLTSIKNKPLKPGKISLGEFVLQHTEPNAAGKTRDISYVAATTADGNLVKVPVAELHRMLNSDKKSVFTRGEEGQFEMPASFNIATVSPRIGTNGEPIYAPACFKGYEEFLAVADYSNAAYKALYATGIKDGVTPSDAVQNYTIAL